METAYRPKTMAEIVADAHASDASPLLLTLLARAAEIDADITSPTGDDSNDRPPTGEDYNLLADAITDEASAEIVRLRDAARVGRLTCPDGQPLFSAAHPIPTDERANTLVRAVARAMYAHPSADSIEVDDNAMVIDIPEAGHHWVAAWVLVRAEDLV